MACDKLETWIPSGHASKKTRVVENTTNIYQQIVPPEPRVSAAPAKCTVDILATSLTNALISWP